MDSLWANIALVLFFILLGGAFAASEIALVSLRESQIRAMAARGGSGVTVARLAGDSNRFAFRRERAARRRSRSG